MIDPTDDGAMTLTPDLAEFRIGAISRRPIDSVGGIIQELPQHIVATAHVENIEWGALYRLQHAPIIRPAECLVLGVRQAIIGGPARGREEEPIHPHIQAGFGKALKGLSPL